MTRYDLSRPVLERVREAADIVQVIADVVTLRKSGRNWMGLCPFHGERTPSFSVSREKGTYYCFGCKRGGDVIDFVMETERLTFAEAVERLANRFSVELPVATGADRQRRDEADALREVIDAAQAWLVRRINDDRPRAFLERRGVSQADALEFGLGYAPAEWRGLYDTLQPRFGERALVAAGLVMEGDGGRVWDRFRDRVTIPIRLPRGTLVAFGGRAVGDDPPKYLNSPETALFSKGRVLFALDRALRSFARTDRAVVVEGYFDCLALHQAGFTETVATLGTALSEHHAKELARRVRRIVVCFDGDAAGRAAAVTALGTLLAADLDAAALLLPDGQDPDELVRREGAEQFGRRLDGAPSAADFLAGELGATRGERRDNLLRLLAVVDRCPNPVRRFEIRERLAQAAGVPIEQLGTITVAPGTFTSAEAVTLPPPGEAALLRALLIDLPLEQRAAALADVPLDAIDHPVVLAILSEIKDLAASGGALEISALGSDIDHREMRRVLAALEHEVPPTGVEHLKLIKRELCEKSRQKRLAELSLEIARAERLRDRSRLAELLREKSTLLRSPRNPGSDRAR
jgi:DNA primase